MEHENYLPMPNWVDLNVTNDNNYANSNLTNAIIRALTALLKATLVDVTDAIFNLQLASCVCNAGTLRFVLLGLKDAPKPKQEETRISKLDTFLW